MAQEPEGPEGPEELEDHTETPESSAGGGIRGRITGVTRVGPKALMLGGLVAAGLVMAISFGLSKPTTSTATLQAPPTIAPQNAAVLGSDHFGEDVPILATPEPTDTPILLPQNAPLPGSRPIQLQTPLPAPTTDPAVLAEEQKRVALLDQAVHSNIINSNVGSGGAPPQSSSSGNGSDATGSNAFINGPFGQSKDDYLPSRRVEAPSQYLIIASSVIPAEIITGIDTEAAGLISAQVREDVYDSKTGRYLLIPRGSRLVGVYKNTISFGQSRVLVAWTRLIFPDTSSIDLANMSGADTEGYAGFAGKVDNHNGMLFEAALMTSLLDAGVMLTQQNNTNSNNNGAPNASQVISSSIGQNIAQVGSQIMSRSLNIAPTIHIPKGYPFLVVVDRDIILPGPYEGS